jgi:GDP-4-dehydro-6-deoxy-D-mannose reductase
MRVVVTGIEGFAGRHLAAALTAGGHSVSGTALSVGDGARPEPTVELDVRDPAAVFGAIDEARPEAVVHLAGRASVASSFDEPVPTWEVNAGGTLNVLEACRRAEVERVLLVTSCEVYGDLDPAAGPAAEDRTMAPISPYGGSKADQDLLGEQYARTFGLGVVRVRSFPHTGPGQREPYLFPSVARRIAEAEADLGPETITVGNVEVVRDLLDVRDVVGAYVLLMERGRPGEVYNVCGGRGRSLRESLEELCGLARRPVRLEIDPSRRRPTDIAWMVGDPAKLRSETGWRPRIEWKETANDLLEEARARVAAGTEREVESDATPG